MLKNAIKIALNTLKKNKGRTLLTVLGIVIGITAVVAVLSAGQAIQSLIVGEVESFGTNIIQIEVKTPQTDQQSTENAFSMVGGSVINTLKEKDAEAIAKHPNVTQYYTGIMGQEVVNFENEFKKAFIFGTNYGYIEIDNSEVEFGRFFDKQEEDALAKVAVIGAKIKDKLFADNDAIGQNIKIGNEQFKVIGQLKERGASFSLDMDNMVFVPVKTLQKRFLGIDYVSYILVQLDDNTKAEQTAEDITYLLRQRHKITDPDKDDFAVVTMDQIMDMLNVIIFGIQILLIVLGSISLIVGGVGIMNIMYVSVTERTAEIGLRKSLGAKNKNILYQFLTEAIILTLTGGIIGIILGILLTYAVSAGAQAFGFSWDFSISITGIILALAMSTVVGLVFGIYPAKQAAKLDPIEALRHE